MYTVKELRHSLMILTAARALIRKPENWTQGSLARDENGLEVCFNRGFGFRRASCWCMEGALYETTRKMTEIAQRPYGHFLLRSPQIADSGKTTLWSFNDEANHANVLAAFDSAIRANQKALADASK